MKECSVNKCSNPVSKNDKCYIHNKIEDKKKPKYIKKKKKKGGLKKSKKVGSTRKRKTIAALKKLARYWFQRWIRLTKTGGGVECCYGCGKWFTTIQGSNACHYLKAELYPEAIFDPNNVFVGCPGCNIRDPLLEYRKWLILKKDLKTVEELENKYKLNRGTYKWDRSYLEELIIKYKELCKEIENP